MRVWEFDLSVDVPRQDRSVGMIYVEMLETCKSVFNISEFGCTCNYTPSDNNKTI